MLTLVGDEELDCIELPNGMKINIDYTIGESKEYGWGWSGRISGEYRRIRLYDKDDNLISELIEENPLYDPHRKMGIPHSNKVIF
ncbi:hypothetical protein [uncultured Methanobrevibacter sp.]|uniref:hypothetical protein n=1 Tax=uncultured Methanobrevibacter sp. TaxID=253161 RepID=UPI0025CD0F60|nr:hypothetical protein [uncultured Methanobrevibacter sp.]